jgi:hypothetical protein
MWGERTHECKQCTSSRSARRGPWPWLGGSAAARLPTCVVVLFGVQGGFDAQVGALSALPSLLELDLSFNPGLGGQLATGEEGGACGLVKVRGRVGVVLRVCRGLCWAGRAGVGGGQRGLMVGCMGLMGARPPSTQLPHPHPPTCSARRHPLPIAITPMHPHAPPFTPMRPTPQTPNPMQNSLHLLDVSSSGISGAVPACLFIAESALVEVHAE